MAVDHEAVEKALNDHLATLSGVPDIQWAGVDYPSMPDEFLFTQILRVRGTNRTYDTGNFPGEFIVTHKMRGGGGTIRGAAICTAVADHFNGLTDHRLSYSGGVINLTQPATPLGPLVSGEWIETPCTVPFWVMG